MKALRRIKFEVFKPRHESQHFLAHRLLGCPSSVPQILDLRTEGVGGSLVDLGR